MNVLDYIEVTDPPEVRELLIAAHELLLEQLPPFVTYAIKWRIPFYKLHRSFCYLNRHKDHFTLGFPHGFKLSPLPGVLLDENGKLKQIRYLEIRSLAELYSERTQQILSEAMMVDEEVGKSARRFSGKKGSRFFK